MLERNLRYDYLKPLQTDKKKNYYVIKNLDSLQCPNCKGELIPKGSHKRHVKFSDFEHDFRFRQLYCTQCAVYHLEIPDFVLPNKHYSRTTIEKILSGEIDYYLADDSTVNRWKKSKNV